MKGKHLTGFTMIEVLGVTAIVAVLGAVVAPAVMSEQARQQICASNERRIGDALLAYTQDYDNKFPMLVYYGDSGYPTDWTNVVQPYVRSAERKPLNAWQCPSFPTAQTYQYGISFALCRNGAGTWEASNVPGYQIISVSRNSISSPSEKAMVLEKGQAALYYQVGWFDPYESLWTNPLSPAAGRPTQPDTHNNLAYDFDCDLYTTDPVCTNYYATPSLFPRFRHEHKSNVLFVDGHVQALGRTELNWWKHIYIPNVYESLYGPPQ